MKTAVVIGATGLVGFELLKLLSSNKDYLARIALVRKIPEQKLEGIEYRQINFEQIEQQSIPENSDMFCALGTTIRMAGSKAAFRKVDYDCVVAFAKLAKARSAQNFVVVSAIGASKNSAIFYSRVKGEMEVAIQNIGLTRSVVIQPSLLVGERDVLGQKSRLGEDFFSYLYKKMPFLSWGPLKKYAPVKASKVAEKMLKVVASTQKSNFETVVFSGDNFS